MKSKSSKFSFPATLVSALLAGTAAHAAISITNHSFELQAVGDGSTGSPTGWAPGNGGVFNTQNGHVTGTTYVDPGTPGLIPGGDGVQVAFMNGSSPMYQNIGTIEANSIYMVTVAIGERLGFGWSNLTVALRASSSTGTLLASDVYDASEAPNGSFTDVSFSFSSADFAAEVGNPLFVTFATTGAQSLFDNVRVTETAIPEPSAALLGGLGLLALLRRRRA